MKTPVRFEVPHDIPIEEQREGDRVNTTIDKPLKFLIEPHCPHNLDKEALFKSVISLFHI